MINWFARNGVAANLVMLIVVVGGVASLLSIKKELFPQFSLDTITVRVPYLGAAPEEVESAVIIRVEEAIQGLEGIKEIRSTAREGIGTVAVEAAKGVDVARLKDEIKTRVDAITSFPAETERPIVEELLIQRDILWVAIHGQASEASLKEMAERARDEITSLPGVSQASVQGIRNYEISIGVSEMNLRKYDLTFTDVVNTVRRHSLDVPAGSLRTSGGEILLRTVEQAYRHNEFASLPLKTNPDGSRVLIGDVATVNDGFTDDPIYTTFNGDPAALILIREVGQESPLDISSKVNAYVEEVQNSWLPDSMGIATWGDSSFYLKARLEMLIENGFLGFLLVMLSLSLFLRPSLAFFVAIGIPVSFLGTFMIAPFIGLSINLVSLFAFILVLGIVVDDAIVVGESVFTQFQKEGPGVESSITGARLVATPVTYAVLTTMVAFIPVTMLPGQLGKFFAAIPLVVIPTLAFSLVQSKLVLPYHLSLCKVGDRKHRDELGRLSRFQRAVADALERFVIRAYRPSLRFALEWRYFTVAGFTGIFILSFGLIAAGWVKFSPFPSVPSDFIQLNLELPQGTPIEQTQAALDRVRSALEIIREEDRTAGKGDPVLHEAEFIGFGSGNAGSNRGFFFIELTKSEVRDSNAGQVSERWRELIGNIPGARRLTINAFAGPPTGLPVDIRITGPDVDELEEASRFMREKLAELPGLYDIRDTFSEGKREIKMTLKPQAELLGISASDLANQVRFAFYGAEAQRIQRGRDEVRVMVRFPDDQRKSLGFLESMRIRSPSGVAVPISEVAELRVGEGFPEISRIDRKRVINVQADADKAVADFQLINETIYGGPNSSPDNPSLLAQVNQKWPGVVLLKGGEAKDWEETRSSLIGGVILVMFLVYALLAIPFKSYFQPFLVMAVIPFGFTGALLGHWVTFQPLSILSMLGIIALSGVVVNDSLVLIDYVNRKLREGTPLLEAVQTSGEVRFRPIILTSLTTFVGLIPILLERSLQAQFLIPMATSLAFGVLFATVITLILIPCLYMILEDVLDFFELKSVS